MLKTWRVKTNGVRPPAKKIEFWFQAYLKVNKDTAMQSITTLN